MVTYEIYYDYCSDEGYEERNCVETQQFNDWHELQDYIKVMREHGCYYNIYASCVSDDDGEAW